MNDCPNAEMRDRLPDLLHDRLSATERAAVTAHLAACVDCHEELELLRDMEKALLAAAPRVDIAYVVNALPKPPARVPAARSRAHRTWADWRIAAAVTLLAAGGSSVALLSRGDQLTRIDTVASTGIPNDTTSSNSVEIPWLPEGGAPVAGTNTSTPTSAEQGETLGMSGHLADLDDAQLEVLIDDIEQMKAVPITEPEPVSIKVDARGQTLPEGL